MTIATVLCSSLVFGGLCAAAKDGARAVIACNLHAISSAERPRYNELRKRLGAAVRDRSEVPDGYVFELNGKLISLSEVAEWIGLERLCCPFLTLEISASGTHPDWRLKISGPDGVKALVETEFPTPNS